MIVSIDGAPSRPAGASVTNVSPCSSLASGLAPFVDPASTSKLDPTTGGVVLAGAGFSSSPPSFTILSSAGRFASGWSFGVDGEEGSSRGRFVDWMGAAVVGEGEADMMRAIG